MAKCGVSLPRTRGLWRCVWFRTWATVWFSECDPLDWSRIEDDNKNGLLEEVICMHLTSRFYSVYLISSVPFQRYPSNILKSTSLFLRIHNSLHEIYTHNREQCIYWRWRECRPWEKRTVKRTHSKSIITNHWGSRRKEMQPGKFIEGKKVVNRLFRNFLAGIIIDLGDNLALGSRVVFALIGEPHRIENIFASFSGRVAGFSSVFVNTCFDQDWVPVVLRGLIEFVRAADVRLGCIADEVHGRWESIDFAAIFPPFLQESGGELICAELRLAEGNLVQDFSCNDEVNSFERCA